MIGGFGTGWRGLLIRLYGDLALKGLYGLLLVLCLRKGKFMYVRVYCTRMGVYIMDSEGIGWVKVPVDFFVYCML